MAAALLWPQPSRAEEPALQQQGNASYYDGSFAGRPTASGEPFNPEALTAASRDLPLGAKAKVTNLQNGRSVDVKINDRGPVSPKKIIDLSKGAARKLGMVTQGVAPVAIELHPSRQPTPAVRHAVEEKLAEQIGEGSSVPPAD